MLANRLVIVAAILATPVLAQTRPNVAAVPDAFTGAHGNAEWVAGITPTNFPAALQWWYRGDSVGDGSPRLIREFGVRAAPLQPTKGAKQDLLVKLSNTAIEFDGLDTTWSKNLSGKETVFFDGKINWGSSTGTNPNEGLVWIKGARPFLFAGKTANLLVHQHVRSFTSSADVLLDMIDQYTSAAVHMPFGRSCGATLSASLDPRPGVKFSVSGAKPDGPVGFMFGVNSLSIGSQTLPIDLSAAGMAGCELQIEPLIFVGTVADKSGSATLSIPFTLPKNALVVKAQAFHASLTSSRLLDTTNATTSVLGQAGLCNQIWALGGSQVATGGPFQFNTAPILLIK